MHAAGVRAGAGGCMHVSQERPVRSERCVTTAIVMVDGIDGPDALTIARVEDDTDDVRLACAPHARSSHQTPQRIPWSSAASVHT